MDWNDPALWVTVGIIARDVITAFMAGAAYVIREAKRKPTPAEPPALPEAPIPPFPTGDGDTTERAR